MRKTQKLTWYAFTPVLLLYSIACLASDIAGQVRNMSPGADLGNGGYFELGLGLLYQTPWQEQEKIEDNKGIHQEHWITASGAYRKNRYFIEAIEGSFDGLNLGATLWHNESWQIDFLAASMSGFLNEDDEYDIQPDDTAAERNKKLTHRDSFYAGAGIRTTFYYEDYIFQHRIVSDIYDNNGLTSSIRLGRHWLFRNWNIHGVLGLLYISPKTNRYWTGITADEANARFPEYRPGSRVDVEAEVGVAYPLSEKWVFRSTARVDWLGSDASDSPLIRKDYVTSVYSSVAYVF